MLRKMILLLAVVSAISIGSVFAAGDTKTLNLDISGLSDLGDSAVYEGWLIVDGAPVSTGIFSIDGTGTSQSFTVATEYAEKADAFVLTIEPANDPDPAPSSIHPIAGSFVDGVADLSVGHPAALGDDFSNAGGGYILAAPSGDNAAYYNGFWFLQDGNPSLNLPTLPEGWAYEGWIVDENGPVSTGTFTDVAAADSDAGGATAGPNPTPPFPGQDFVNPPVNLLGKTVVISIEPVPDNSPAPFDYKPLLDVAIDDVKAAGGFQGLQQNLGSLATGKAYFGDAKAAPSTSANSAPAAPSAGTTSLQIDISGLSDLGDSAVYEGWLIVDGAPVSSGVFNIDGTGTSQSFSVPTEYADKATAFVLTIEPANDPDPAPAATHVLAGEFNNGRAVIGVAHPAALGSDFSNAGGGYILAAPSGDNVPYYNGFWFLQDGNPSLNLPTLPEGWAYEGWIVDENGPVSTGTFTDVAAADSDAGGATAGPNPTPPFPGQDFVNPPVNLLGKTVVVSIEPVPDNSLAPFDYKPLLDVTIDDVGEAGGFQTLQQNLGSLATGTAVFVQGATSDAGQLAEQTAAQPAPVAADAGNSVIVFNTPAGADGPGPLFPDNAYEVTFDAGMGKSLHFATMLVQTNDYFFSPNEWGIALYDEDGQAKSGDVTDYVHLWDAGTELNERPGSGIYQAPRQTGPNSGAMDINAKVRRAHDNYSLIPAVNQLINVTLTHNGGTNFTLSIGNVSGSSSFASPLAPGVVVVTDQVAPIFDNQFYDRGLGLEAIAEDGNPAILAGNLN